MNNDVKKQLTEVLESKPRFREENVDKVFVKINEKQSKQHKQLKVFGAAFIVAAALFALFLLKPTPNPIDETIQLSESEMETALLQHFEDFTVNSGYNKIVHYEMGYERENIALIISTGGVEVNHFVSLHEFKNNKWQAIYSQTLASDRLMISTDPIVYASRIESTDPADVFIGDEKVELIKVNDFAQIFVSMQDDTSYPVIVNYKSIASERLMSFSDDEDSSHYTIPIVSKRANDDILYTNEFPTMRIFEDEYMAYPLVVDTTYDKLKLFDVVLIDDGISTPTLSRIVALPHSSFAVENGTIVRNRVPQHTRLGIAKVDNHSSFESYKMANDVSVARLEHIESIFKMNVPEVTLADDQYMTIGDNWDQSGIALVKQQYIKGIVRGYDLESMRQTWTVNERAIYQQLQQSKDRSRLKDLDAKTIARLFFYAQFEADAEMSYFFYTTIPTEEGWTMQEHMESYGYNSSNDNTSDNNRMYNANFASYIQQGEFKEEQGKGYIYMNDGSVTLRINLIFNDEGYWELSFN